MSTLGTGGDATDAYIRPHSGDEGDMADGMQPTVAIGETRAPAPGGPATSDAFDAFGVGTVIDERYRVERRIAAGGMATVFLAADLRHDREVAVKVLHASLAHTIGVQRFLREIEVIARLQHPHLLTLIDSGTVGGLPYYVMPYVEAQSLRETIAERGRLSLDDAVRIMREIADGLAYAHARGVVHRDIKPSNVLMSDGHAMIADFGIATAIRKSTVGRITVTGTSLGSPTYMSPEQAAGEPDVDARSDVYSLGCVLFEMLAGGPPIDHHSLQQLVTQKLIGGYTRLHDRRPDLPAALEGAIDQALAPDRAQRFASIDDFARAVSASLPTTPVVSRRTRWIAVAVAVVALGSGAALTWHQRRIVWATRQVAEVNRLVHEVKLHAAFTLAGRLLPILPGDSTLRVLRPLFTDFLRVVTVPAGARVSIRRLGDADSTWTTVGVTPLDSLAMPKLLAEMGYQMRIERAGYERVDLLASVFTDLRGVAGRGPLDTLYLDPLGMPTAGMARVRGFTAGGVGGSFHVGDYHLGKREVSNHEYQRFVDAGGYRDRAYWTEPMVRGGDTVPWRAGVAALVDRTGQPGPSTWREGTYPSGQGAYPVGGLSWYEAAAYARFAKMQLPTLDLWQEAAARNHREVFWMFARSSNLNGTGPRPVGQGTMSAWGLYDVAGNVREWCVNPVGTGRLTQGGTWEDSPFNMRHLIALDPFDRSPGNGVRLARYEEAAAVVARLARPLARSTPRDYRDVVAVSDATFDGFRRMYDYDARPLDVRLEGSGETPTTWWQKVTFTAAYAGPRMAAYLFFPRDASGPFEPVMWWGAANELNERRLDPRDASLEMFSGFIPRSGRVLVVPLYLGTYERDDSTFSIHQSTPDTTTYYRDLMVQWIKDLRRTIDFLETRNDVRADRVGFYGASWGSANAPIALAIEPRIKAAVLFSAGYPSARARPEVEEFNYAPRVRAPTLMLNGRYDTVFPYETSQQPFFDQLGTSEKELVLSDHGHIVSSEEMVPASLRWFDRYLSRRLVPATERKWRK